jgi:uncharacterized membrane protein
VVLRFFGIGVKPALVNRIDLMVQYLIQFFIVVGVLTLWRLRKLVNGEFLSYASVGLILVVSGVVLPYFSSSLNESRIYQFSLIFLAPACVLGGEIVFRNLSYVISALRQRSWHVTLPSSNGSLTFASCFIILFLLFNTGFINEISGAPPNAFALGMNRIRGSNNPTLVLFLYGVYLPEQDYAGARWFSSNTLQNQTVCMDSVSSSFLLAYSGVAPVQDRNLTEGLDLVPLGLTAGLTPGCRYAYLSYLNMVKGIVETSEGYDPISKFSNLDYQRNRIYSNGATVILAFEQ